MIEINLVPDVKQELIRAQRARTVVTSLSIVTTIVALGVVGLLLSYVFGVQTLRSSYLDRQISDKAETLSKVEDLSKILTIKNQLSMIDDINAQKNLDSRVYDVIAAVTPPAPNEVKFSDVSIDAEAKTIRLEGQTTDYTSMEIFKKTLDSAVVKFRKDDTDNEEKLANNIDTSEVSYGQDATGTKVLRFALTFEYFEDYFSTKVNAPVIKLSINGNVTDSYLGIPRSLFTDRAKDSAGGQ